MKKCPTCQRTFEDAMRFCQSDGTPLVDDAPPVDPYKTMVASSEELKASMGPPVADPEPSEKADEEVLQLPPEVDPKKTMFVSEEELRKEMGKADEPIVELPPPEPPKFSEPSLSPPPFGDVSPASPASPPPSPFSPASDASEEPAAPASEDLKNDLSGDPPFMKTTPPIPSPFDRPKGAAYDRPASFSPPPKAEPSFGSASEPLESAAAPIEASASAPVQNWEPNEPMQNAPVSAGPSGQNQTLAIVSLVAGILGVTLCCGTVLPSLLAAVLGFMARSKANNDPANYGGAGLALGGIITGILGIILSIGYLIFVFFLGGLQLIMQGAR
ncbi:MAG: DUF4190 domain-containing protein [Pyrinomonadaceae bacterium]